MSVTVEFSQNQYYRGILRTLEMFWGNDKPIKQEYFYLFESDIKLVRELNKDGDFREEFIAYLESISKVEDTVCA